MQKTQKKSLLLALALAVSASSWAQKRHDQRYRREP